MVKVRFSKGKRPIFAYPRSARKGGIPVQNAHRASRLWRAIAKNWGLYLLIAPSFILLLFFTYFPMYGVQIAFKDYNLMAGITRSPWADPWYKYFQRFFNSYQSELVIKNTLLLGLYSIAAGYPIPILLGLLINQMRPGKFRRVYQTVTYIPHFISTVVLVGMLNIMLSPSSGLIGAIYKLFGAQAPNLLASPRLFPSLYVWSDVWQNAGWDAIVYLAALASVDPNLYEAATVDGAGKRQKMLYIDLPMLLPMSCVMLILRAGGIMNVSFEKAYLMQNDLNLSVSEMISTYVYKLGIINSQYSLSAAVNLFNTLVNLALLLLVNQITRHLGDTSIL